MEMKQMKITTYSERILYTMLVFYLFFITDSLIFQVNANPIFNRASQITLLIVGPLSLLIFFGVKKLRIKYSFILLLLIIAFMIVTYLLNIDNRLVVLIKIMVLIFGYSISKLIDVRKFSRAFIHSMVFIAIYSLFFYFISDFIININILPKITTLNGFESVFLLFTNLPVINSNYRNWGLFWEPGAYQVYLSIAIFLLLFYYKTTKTKKIVLFSLFLITFFTVLSTTGLITLPFIILAFVLNSNDRSISTIYKFLLVIIVSVFAVSFFVNEELVNRVFLSKFLDPLQTDRFDTIKYGIELWIRRPFFGYGSFYREAMHFAAGKEFSITNTIVVNFVAFGVFFGSYFLYSLKQMIDSLQASKTATIILYIGVGLMLSGNNFIYSPTIALFMFLRFNRGVLISE